MTVYIRYPQASGSVPTTTTINTTSPLTGGGPLSGDLTLAFDFSVSNTWTGSQTYNNNVALNFGTAGSGAQTAVANDGSNLNITRTGVGAPKFIYDGGFTFCNTVAEFCQIGPTPTLFTPSNLADRFSVCRTSAATTGNQRGMILTCEASNTATSSAAFSGINAAVGTTVTNTAAITASTLGGGCRNRYIASFFGTGLVTQASAITAVLQSTGTIGTVLTTGTCFHAEGATPASGSTFTLAQGFWFHPTSPAGTITTYIGARIDMPIGGGTNIQMTLAGTGIGSGIYFNSSTTIGTEFIQSSASGLLDLSASTAVNANSDLKITTVGKGLYIKEGANATSGVATLSAGTVVVSTTKVTASSRIYLTVQSLGTVAVATPIAVTARSAGTSFTISSSAVTDTSTVAWLIIEPA